MRKGFWLFLLIVILTSAVIGGIRSRESRQPHAVSGQQIDQSFGEATEFIKQHYVSEVDTEALTRNALNTALHTLDPHSNYFTRHDFQQLEEDQSSKFYGIGVSINRRNGHVYILTETQGAPAEKAGLRYGDEIIAINGEDASNWDGNQVQDKVRGDRGKPVSITVNRAGEKKPVTIKIVRDAVPYPSVRGVLMVRPGIGYIALVGGFNQSTEDELGEAIDALRTQGMRQMLVLDLRNNPGGLLNEAVAVSQKFLAKGLNIVSMRGRNFAETVHQSENPTPDEIPLVVLINRGSASASEIVAGAIQDHDRGLIVGENSFGKGLVQTIFHPPYGTGLLLTTAKYYTPSGRSIQRDYSVGSYYSYFQTLRGGSSSTEEIPESSRQVVRTDSGRTVYGGGGITPDVEVKSPEADEVRNRIFNSTFEFARQLCAGQVKGFEGYKIAKTRYGYSLRGDEYPVTDPLIEAYRDFISKNDKFKISEKHLVDNLSYIQNRIRDEVITAAYGLEAGIQIQLQADPQLLKALESYPQAKQLADNVYMAKKR